MKGINSIIVDQILQSFYFFLPESILFCLFIILIISGLIFKKHQAYIIPVISLIGLVAVIVSEFAQLQFGYKLLFSANLFFNSKVIFFKLVMAVSCILTLFFSLISKQIQDKKDQLMEYYSIIVAILLGSNLLVMSANMVIAFLSLELISIGSYILVCFVFTKQTAEAAIKYILFGMFSSGIMLYGLSFLYGFTGTTNFISQEFILRLSLIDSVPVAGAILLTFAGIFFKISLFPFHLWTPDVYEATPNPLVAFFSTTTKIAGLGFFYNILTILWSFQFKLGHLNLSLVVAIIAMATVLLGNFAALRQDNIKRMLGYSAIAQSGFLVLPLVSNTPSSLFAFHFYIVIYTIMSFGVFYLAEKLSFATGSDKISSAKGLGLQYPFWGISAIIIMVALIGLPPTAGFMAKFFAFITIWSTFTLTSDPLFLILFIVALLNTVIALFFYLKLPYFMFFNKKTSLISIKSNWYDYLFIGIICMLLILFFIKADYLVKGIQHFISYAAR